MMTEYRISQLAENGYGDVVQYIRRLELARNTVAKLLPPREPQPLTLSSGQIARCMTLVSDPLLWGRMGEQCGVIAEEFARAVLAAAQEKP